jgi:hypothetical protein
VNVDGLELGVMGDRAIAERQPDRMGLALGSALAAQDLCGEEEVLDLILADSRFLAGEKRAANRSCDK